MRSHITRSVATALTAACVLGGIAGTAVAQAAPARPDLTVTLPVLGPRAQGDQIPFSITIRNRGNATATDIAVVVTSIPPTGSDGFTVESIRPGETRRIATRSMIGRILIGQVTVSAKEKQRDANPANNTISGFRFLVG